MKFNVHFMKNTVHFMKNVIHHEVWCPIMQRGRPCLQCGIPVCNVVDNGWNLLSKYWSWGFGNYWQNELLGWDDEHDSFFWGGWYLFSCAPLTVMPHPACILFAGFCLCIFPCLCACFFVGFFFLLFTSFCLFGFLHADYRSTACPTAHLIFVFLCFFFWFLLLLLCHTLHACFLFAGFCLCIFSCLCACFFAAFFLLFTSFCLFGFLHAFFKTIARPPAQLPT